MKRCLRVPDRPLQDATLKLYKRMVPYTPRKWRQTNMKIITQIYLRCPPRLRDDWMSVVETEGEAAAAFVAREMAMRGLVQQYNVRHFPGSVSELGFGGILRAAEAAEHLPDDDEAIWEQLKRELEIRGEGEGASDRGVDDFFAQELAKDVLQL